MERFLRSSLALVALSYCANAYAASRDPALAANTSALVFLNGIGVRGPLHYLNDVAGPLESKSHAGAVLRYNHPSYPPYSLEATLFADSSARTDYGSNGAAVKVGLRPVNGDDRGQFPSGDYQGQLPHNSSVEPQAYAESTWTDRFVIYGGLGTGTAHVSVALSGRVQTSYGENGTIWYEGEPDFETFGRSGDANVNYQMSLSFDHQPPGTDSEGNNTPINVSRAYNAPNVPDSVTIIGPPETLTGTFVFEYGLPFSITSALSISGYEQIDADFSHTATLSMFDLPDGAALFAESGHIYPGSNVPEPAGFVLAIFLFPLFLGTARVSDSSDGHRVPLAPPVRSVDPRTAILIGIDARKMLSI